LIEEEQIMIRKIPIIILASALAGVAVAAQEFSKLDSDQNGAISKAEATALPDLYNNWNEADVDADGLIDQAEFSKFEAMPSEPQETDESEETVE
jgi:Ca2+-binding EF-hand superfamily protein